MKTEITKSPKDDIRKIMTIMIGTIVVVAGAATLLRLGKIMVIDLNEMGL